MKISAKGQINLHLYSIHYLAHIPPHKSNPNCSALPLSFFRPHCDRFSLDNSTLTPSTPVIQMASLLVTTQFANRSISAATVNEPLHPPKQRYSRTGIPYS